MGRLRGGGLVGGSSSRIPVRVSAVAAWLDLQSSPVSRSPWPRGGVAGRVCKAEAGVGEGVGFELTDVAL